MGSEQPNHKPCAIGIFAAYLFECQDRTQPYLKFLVGKLPNGSIEQVRHMDAL
jgi:hypothetical protein